MKVCVVFNLIVESVAVVTAIISIYLYGNGWKYSGYFGLFSQIWWVLFTHLNEHTTLYVLCFFMIITHIRNIFKMRQK